MPFCLPVICFLSLQDTIQLTFSKMQMLDVVFLAVIPDILLVYRQTKHDLSRRSTRNAAR